MVKTLLTQNFIAIEEVFEVERGTGLHLAVHVPVVDVPVLLAIVAVHCHQSCAHFDHDVTWNKKRSKPIPTK